MKPFWCASLLFLGHPSMPVVGAISIALGFAKVRLVENVSYGLGRVLLTPVGGLGCGGLGAVVKPSRCASLGDPSTSVTGEKHYAWICRCSTHSKTLVVASAV